MGFAKGRQNLPATAITQPGLLLETSFACFPKFLHFQPPLRWRHSQQGMVSSAGFGLLSERGPAFIAGSVREAKQLRNRRELLAQSDHEPTRPWSQDSGIEVCA